MPGGSAFIWLASGFSFNGFSFGIQTYHKLNDRFDINPGILMSGNLLGADLALPIQLYKTDNNNFGLKISPFVNYARIDSLSVERTNYSVEQSVVNWGVKMSAGYYLTQKLSLGAYYKYNQYNFENHKQLKNADLHIWWNNIYDVSFLLSHIYFFQPKNRHKEWRVYGRFSSEWNGMWF